MTSCPGVGHATTIAHVATDEGRLTRREMLAKRAPSQARIEALIERLPSSDEWLDDEYDWAL